LTTIQHKVAKILCLCIELKQYYCSKKQILNVSKLFAFSIPKFRSSGVDQLPDHFAKYFTELSIISRGIVKTDSYGDVISPSQVKESDASILPNEARKYYLFLAIFHEIQNRTSELF